MHPQIVRDGPGTCPLCGMALEPVLAIVGAGEDPELVDMRRRFWISALLSLSSVSVVANALRLRTRRI